MVAGSNHPPDGEAGGATADPAAVGGGPVDPAAVPDPADLRLRAAARVSAAYSAMHGHPTPGAGFAGPEESERARWRMRPGLALAAGLAVVVLALVTVVGPLLRSGSAPVVTIAERAAERGGAPSGTAAGAPSSGSGAGTGASTRTGAGAGERSAGGGCGPGADCVVVHVVGQVRRPGIVTLAAGARVTDALAAVGGLLPAADTAAVNLARPVVDGEQIVVPRPGEAPVSAGAGGGTGGPAGAVIDLNSADAATLDELPGIGPVLAERIVEWRAAHGRFTDVDELTEVDGIGPALVAKLRDRVRV